MPSWRFHKNELRETFQINAVYYDSGHVEISYLDKSDSTELVVMEVLGMEESFQKQYGAESEFIEIIPFPTPPKYGWEIHPIVLEVDHTEFGHVQIKTEIRPMGEPAEPVIYSRS